MAILLPDVTKPRTAKSGHRDIDVDTSHRFGVGIMHLRVATDGREEGSYSQVFNTQHRATRAEALSAAHARIEAHPGHGTYDAKQHNPTGDLTHHEARSHVEYNQFDSILSPAECPKFCSICNTPISLGEPVVVPGKNKDDKPSLQASSGVYIPHVDDSTRGLTYQSILQKTYPNATIAELTLGACSFEHAQQLAHSILDEIIEPDFKASGA